MASSLLSKTFREAGGAIIDASSERPGKTFEHFIKMLRQLHIDRPFLTDPYERSITFIMEQFAKSVQMNMFVDTPFTQSLEQARSGLLEEMGQPLLSLANALEQNDRISAQDAITSMINAYLNCIETLNREFEKSRAARTS